MDSISSQEELVSNKYPMLSNRNIVLVLGSYIKIVVYIFVLCVI